MKKLLQKKKSKEDTKNGKTEIVKLRRNLKEWVIQVKNAIKQKKNRIKEF